MRDIEVDNDHLKLAIVALELAIEDKGGRPVLDKAKEFYQFLICPPKSEVSISWSEKAE